MKYSNKSSCLNYFTFKRCLKNVSNKKRNFKIYLFAIAFYNSENNFFWQFTHYHSFSCTQFSQGGDGYKNEENKFKTFLTFPANRYTIALQSVGDALTGLAIFVNLIGILVIGNAASFKAKKTSNAKLLFMYLSVLIIIQSAIKFAMMYAETSFKQKQYVFLSFAAFLLLRRLTMVVLSIDQIAIIKLDFHYKILFTKQTIIFLVLPSYIVAIEFVVLRLVFRDFVRSQIVTTCNVLAADSAFVIMTLVSIFFINLFCYL